jgi:hypothetical protein
MIRTRIKDGENKDDKPKDQEKPKPQPSGISKQRLENLWMPWTMKKKNSRKVNASKVKKQQNRERLVIEIFQSE